jgi:hypothetical protein
VLEARFALGRFHRLGNGFHHDALFLTLSLLCGEALFSPLVTHLMPQGLKSV